MNEHEPALNHKIIPQNAVLCEQYVCIHQQEDRSIVHPHYTPPLSAPLKRRQTVLSNSSFASLIFVARYGLPPRSGWLSSISCRWFLRTLSFVKVRSLEETHPSAVVQSKGEWYIREFQDQGGLATSHLRFEASVSNVRKITRLLQPPRAGRRSTVTYPL
jgi:hypothetical protein